MINDSLIYILLVLSSISLIVAITSLVIVIAVLKKQKDILNACRSKQVSSQMVYSQIMSDAKSDNVHSKVEDTNKYGIIICRKCYAPIPENSVACSFCKSPVGRR